MILLSRNLQKWSERRAEEIWQNLIANHLWQRMLKNTLASTITVALALIPTVDRFFGPADYLAPMITVFGHPGRRFGEMAESLVLIALGSLLGVGWSILGIYVSSLVMELNPTAAYTIRGSFLAVAIMLHGFLRSHTPRLFFFVMLLVIVCVVSLTGTAAVVSTMLVTDLLYPIFSAIGVLLLVNVSIFPEFSSTFLGTSTIETLGETVEALRDAGKYFVVISKHISSGEQNFRANQRHTQHSTAVEDLSGASGYFDSTWKKLIHVFRRKISSPAVLVDNKQDRIASVQLKSLTDKKSKLRAKLASCKAAEQECMFELAWTVLPPRDLEYISDTQMKKLVSSTIALIGGCESKYALMGDESDMKKTDSMNEISSTTDILNFKIFSPMDQAGTNKRSRRENTHKKEIKSKSKSKSKSRTRLRQELKDLEFIKPEREIESGDVELLRYLVGLVADPLSNLQGTIEETIDVITSCLAYCFNVPCLPCGARSPSGISLEEIDIRLDTLITALSDFDRDSASALESAAALQNIDQSQVDIMPRMEIFLISSFLLNLRQAALHTLAMLKYSRLLVSKYQERHSRRTLYIPQIDWRRWLSSGGEQDSSALPENARKDVRTGTKKFDIEKGDVFTIEGLQLSPSNMESATTVELQVSSQKISAVELVGRKDIKGPKGSVAHQLRNSLADILEYLVGSEDLLFALKLTVGVFLLAWPAFLPRLNTWYSVDRGLWSVLQLVWITDVAIGTSVSTFILRGFGTALGCLWGYAADQAGDGNQATCVVILVMGMIPSTYIQLGSQYVKAGMVAIISMCVVVLATENQEVRDNATGIFLKRLIAFLIGGTVALIIVIVLFPVRARDRLVESLASSIRQISEMEACLTFGTALETNVSLRPNMFYARFEVFKRKADDALSAAETFLTFCANEPRLKGSFEGRALIYTEILYVLHAIVDRMDNMLYLRQQYGHGALEEFNEKVSPYHRNVAGSTTLVLFAVHEALTTKLPLPQFLPSARLAHLRMINRVRELVGAGVDTKENDMSETGLNGIKRLVRQKFLCWNAGSAGHIEIIEYLEQLVDLVKLLVGANEFRSGLLTRPTYSEYVKTVGCKSVEEGFSRGDTADEHKHHEQVHEDELPRPLQRVRSNRVAQMQPIEQYLRQKRGGRNMAHISAVVCQSRQI